MGGDVMTFGEWIRNKRQANGLTLEDVGNAIGMGKSSVSKLERGVSYGIHIDRISPLCKVLNVSTDDLLDAWDKYGK